jgi:hypothetical protein
MTSESLKLVVRVAKCVVCLAMAGGLVWRSNTYTEPSGPTGMMPSILCSIAAMFLVFLGLAIAFQAGGTGDIEFDVSAE